MKDTRCPKLYQPTLAWHLGKRREALLLKGFEVEDWGDLINEEMETKRRFLQGLKKGSILKRGFVDLPLLGPVIGVNAKTAGVTVPTEAFQTRAVASWVEGYWVRYGFETSWRVEEPCDSFATDWPRHAVHIIQGPTTPVHVLRIGFLIQLLVEESNKKDFHD